MYPYGYIPAPTGPLETLGAPAPVYVILIIGMVLFMASNTMPALLPDPEKIGQVAPMILQWGFGICLLALLTTMTGLVPGVPQLHITYVHLAIAFILFFLIWNQIVADIPEEKRSSSASSSSSSSSKKDEKPPEKKESKEKAPETSPWDDLRAHPSAFLTTRLNRYLPWPFPMGRAAAAGPELWWENGQPAHVGHFNRPEPEVKESEEERKKRKEKEAAKEKEKEKAKAKAEAEKEAEQKKKMKEAEEAKKKEMEKMKAKAVEAARLKAIEDRQKQKLWRTKYLAMIIGIGLVNRTFGFLLLLFFSIQLVSQELNAKPIPEAPIAPSSAPSSQSTSSRSEPRPSSSEPKSSSSSSDAENAKRAKLEAMKQQQEEKAKEGKKASSSSSSKPESPSSRSRESSSSSKEGSSSSRSSSSKSDVVGSAAIREAAGSTTVTGTDPDSSIGVPYNLGFGMYYIHTTGEKKDLDIQPAIVPSQGIAHPLMSSSYKGWAN